MDKRILILGVNTMCASLLLHHTTHYVEPYNAITIRYKATSIKYMT